LIFQIKIENQKGSDMKHSLLALTISLMLVACQTTPSGVDSPATSPTASPAAGSPAGTPADSPSAAPANGPTPPASYSEGGQIQIGDRNDNLMNAAARYKEAYLEITADIESNFAYPKFVLTFTGHNNQPLNAGFTVDQIESVSMILDGTQRRLIVTGAPKSLLALSSTTGRLQGVFEGTPQDVGTGGTTPPPKIRLEFNVPMPTAP